MVTEQMAEQTLSGIAALALKIKATLLALTVKRLSTA